MDDPKLILASSSPRRIQMIGDLGIAFAIQPADIDETPHADEDAKRYVERLAREKAHKVAAELPLPAVPVLAADTTVVLDDVIIGKPDDESDAKRILAMLSGRTHLVHTSVALVVGADVQQATVTTEVEFAALDSSLIDWYVGLGVSLDKAGGYGLQGPAAVLVREVRGSVSNVVGLPMHETVAMLRAIGLVPKL
jgi:septum formation protein